MSRDLPTRRHAVAALAGAALAAGRPATAQPAKGPPPKPTVTDCHFHLVGVRIDGVKDEDLKPPEDAAVKLAPFDPKDAESPKKLAALIAKAMTAAGVGNALCMPRHEVSDRDPLGIAAVEAVAELVRGPKLHPVGLVHPERYDRDHLARVEEVLKAKRVKALKAYLGYLHYGPGHKGFRPYYDLAAKYDVPVVFHTGDTFSKVALLEYANPRHLDAVAVKFPKTKFVMAHFGNPYLVDAAAVLYKNENVYADLSGILVGDRNVFARYDKPNGILPKTVRRIRAALDYVETHKKFLFGSDWPLAPLAEYISFVGQLFPDPQERADVFHNNAKALFGL